MSTNPTEKIHFSATEWLILLVAIIGFAFDIYELLMLPIIAGPALAELLQVPPDNPLVRQWIGIMFWSTAVAGGVFGLLGGWLIDRFGRKKILVLSILIYALSPVAAAFSTSAYQLLLFRCTTFIGVCVEFVAAVAWLAELFPEPKRRELVLGVTQAFSSVGGLLVTGANFLTVKYASELPALPLSEPFNPQASWRYTLITGLFPAIPILLLLPFLPESPVWKRKREEGTLKRPSIGELFGPTLRRTTITSTILFACAYGAAFGAIQLTPAQIAPGVPELAEQRKQLAPLRQQASELNAQYGQTQPGSPERKAVAEKLAENRKLQKPYDDEVKNVGNRMQLYQELGGLAGRIAFAGLVLWIVSRRLLLWVFQIPGIFALPLVFGYAAHQSATMLQWGVALAAFLTVAQFSYWGNYLPTAFPAHLRGTAGSFAANVGGRMIGTSAAFVTTSIVAPFVAKSYPQLNTFAQTAYAAAIVGSSVFLLGFVVSFWLSEPPKETTE